MCGIKQIICIFDESLHIRIGHRACLDGLIGFDFFVVVLTKKQVLKSYFGLNASKISLSKQTLKSGVKFECRGCLVILF